MEAVTIPIAGRAFLALDIIQLLFSDKVSPSRCAAGLFCIDERNAISVPGTGFISEIQLIRNLRPDAPGWKPFIGAAVIVLAVQRAVPALDIILESLVKHVGTVGHIPDQTVLVVAIGLTGSRNFLFWIDVVQIFVDLAG